MKFNAGFVLPKTINNHYQGNQIAKYTFYLIIAFTLVRSLIHIFSSDGGAQSIATIPLDTYGEDSARAVIFVFALWGLSQLLMGILYLVVALRYRSLIPLTYILIVFEYIGRMLIGFLKPLVLSGTAPGGIGNYVLVPFALLMFFLSISTRNKQTLKKTTT